MLILMVLYFELELSTWLYTFCRRMESKLSQETEKLETYKWLLKKQGVKQNDKIVLFYFICTTGSVAYWKQSKKSQKTAIGHV